MNRSNLNIYILGYGRWLITIMMAIVSLQQANGQVLKLDSPNQYHSAPFTHPGLLHSSNDLLRMKEMVAQGKEPWKSAFQKFS